MVLSLFRRKTSEAIVDRLYFEIVAAARRPVFFLPPFGAADTLEGRFEILTVHAFLVLRHLSAAPPPAPDLAQDLTNRIFAGFDAALRESGVGDLTVPKRMKKLAGDFGGRNAAYARAFESGGSLEAAVARNVYGQAEADGANRLAAWMRAADAALAPATLRDFERGLPALPEPALEGSQS